MSVSWPRLAWAAGFLIRGAYPTHRLSVSSGHSMAVAPSPAWPKRKGQVRPRVYVGQRILGSQRGGISWLWMTAQIGITVVSN
ncbi:hypothetical protein BJ166DRAFT_517993 [Pestalotiopsis sp. NC0098]|nr:hypothetical protein BJ166DRAFT_517993 [Pestalotiopsis sp. NC0098]